MLLAEIRSVISINLSLPSGRQGKIYNRDIFRETAISFLAIYRWCK